MGADKPPLYPQPLTGEEEQHGAFIEGIPGYVLTLGLGLLAFGLTIAAWVPDLLVLAYADIPVAFLCFFFSSVVCLGSKRHRGLAFAGVLLNVVALALSLLHLLTANDHPWLWR